MKTRTHTDRTEPSQTALPDPKRRSFLGAATGAGALGALAALAGPAAAVEAAALAPVPQAPAPSGYHETEHIRTYYRTARYW